MGKLLSKLLRDIRQSLGQFMAFALVIAVGVFFYTALLTLSSQLSTYTERYFAEHNLSDLNVYYSRISQQELEALALSKVEGIRKLEGRYTFDATQVFDTYKASLRIHSIPTRNEINTVSLLEGSLPSQKGELLLDSRYAAEHHFRVGDEVVIRVDDKDIPFRISGLGENVEHVKKNETQDHKSYGIGYMAEASVAEIAGALIYNEVIIDAEAGYDTEQLGKSIEAKSKPLSYLGQESKERSFGYAKLQETIHNNGLMSKVMPMVFFVIEAVILFLAMTRMIDSERNQVGIMKALGVKNSSIILHYMGYPVLVGIMGSIMGYVLSAFVFVPLIKISNARSYSMPGIQFQLSLDMIVPPLMIACLLGMVACYFSSRTILKERAAQAIRPKPPRAVRRIGLERISGLWSRLPYSYKLILRNIFLNKSKALAGSVGVIVSTALLVTAFGTQGALQRVADQIEEVYTYDLRVDYKMEAVPHTLTMPSEVKNSYWLSSFPVELVKDKQKAEANLVVTDKNNNLIRFFDKQDNPILLEDQGVLVPKSYADKYHIAEGDMIELAFTAPEMNQKTAAMKVLHISNQYSNPSFYVTPQYLKSFGLMDSPTSLLVETNSQADLDGVRSFFEQDSGVRDIADKTGLRKSADYMMQQNNFMFIMFIACAVILSFGTIYTISSINIYERNRELATLKVLGYQKYRINRLIFSENMIITVFAALVALPVGTYMYSFVVKALSSTHQQIPNALKVDALLLSILLALLLTILSNLILRRKVTKINMIESLKSVE